MYSNMIFERKKYLDGIIELLRSKYLLPPIHYEGITSIEQLEIPEDVLREAICNAIVHRDYMGVHTHGTS